MISYIEGHLLFLESNHVVVKTNGIGYHILLSKRDLENVTEGQNVSFFIHTHVREDALELYGFESRLKKQIFLLLISVSGIGPKLALNILSTLHPESLLSAIINKDINRLSSISGIGKKTAERLSLELKDKASKIALFTHSEPNEQYSVMKNLEQAILHLGYSKSQSDKAILSLDQKEIVELPLEALIKKTLNILTRNTAP